MKPFRAYLVVDVNRNDFHVYQSNKDPEFGDSKNCSVVPDFYWFDKEDYVPNQNYELFADLLWAKDTLGKTRLIHRSILRNTAFTHWAPFHPILPVEPKERV